MSAKEFNESLWTITLPDIWWAESGDDCTTIFHQDGVGALQIETFQKEGVVSEEDLNDLGYTALESGEPVETVRLGEFNGFSLTRNDDGEFWRFWYVAESDCALAITYNCDYEDRTKEAGVVLEILRSLKRIDESE